MDRRKPSLPFEPAKPSKGSVYLKMAALVFSLLIVAALLIDLHNMAQRPQESVSVTSDLQTIALGMDGPRYVSPDKPFSIVPPAGWTTITGGGAFPYDVVFSGPMGADISILVSEVEYNTMTELLRAIEKKEDTMYMQMRQEPLYFRGVPAVKRSGRIYRAQVFAIDFVKDHVAHHILCTAPPDYFEQYEPVMLEVLGTYRIEGSQSTPAESNDENTAPAE